MNKEFLAALREAVEASIEQAIAAREPGADGYYGRTERTAANIAWETLATLLEKTQD